jgi:hypothetical protein
MSANRRHNKINRVLKEFKQQNAVPSHYRRTLEDRLVIAFTPNNNDRPRINGTPRPLAVNRRNFEQKRARKVYLDILKRSPHVFLPFLVVTSPKVCETFDSFEFHQGLKITEENKLSNSVEKFLQDIGNKHGITQNPDYMELIKELFPKGP